MGPLSEKLLSVNLGQVSDMADFLVVSAPTSSSLIVCMSVFLVY